MFHKEIYKFNPESLTWTEVGQTPYEMKENAVIAITEAEATALCPTFGIMTKNIIESTIF